MISVKHLIKNFGRFRAVDDLSFRVGSGESLALWGSNGAGKTTVIRCLLGLLRYQGTIQVAGRDVRKHGKIVRNAIGYVPQELAFHDDLRALEALHFFARLRKVDRTRPDAVLEEVGLSAHGRKRIRELSGGMKQRLALALALLADPPLLVLDELTSNLDTTAQRSFTELLQDQKKRGKTMLFTSHRLDEIESIADRVIVLEAGRQKTACAPDELADTLGLRCTMQVFVDHELLDDAVRTLAGSGFDASRNGRSLTVDVPLHEKAGPIRVLSEASIAVRNFEFRNGQTNQTTNDAPQRREEVQHG